jgi:predicted RNase H-like HicB family nuclease
LTDYRVVYKRDRKNRGWVAHVKGHRRVKAVGRTLRDARDGLREALATLEDATGGTADLVEDVKLPSGARRLIVRHWAARRKVEREEERARDASVRAARTLLELGIPLKDVADLLGLSTQKAQELLG